LGPLRKRRPIFSFESGAGAESGAAKIRGMGSPRVIVGWRERISLPEWGVHDLVAKLDTGARTSSLHAEELQHLPDGQIRFRVVLSRKTGRSQWVTCTPFRTSTIKSSNGHVSERDVVQTLITLGGQTFPIDINLSFRGRMTHRMLIGRAALDSRFLVDPNHTFLHSPLAL